MKTGLVLGLDGVGKSVLIRQCSFLMRQKQHKSAFRRLLSALPSSNATYANDRKLESIDVNTQPTTGVEHHVVQCDKSRTVTLCEIGGELSSKWLLYFRSCDFWIYIVDLTNPSQLPGAASELFNILSDSEMARKHKVIVLNKIDTIQLIPDNLLDSYLLLNIILGKSEFAKTSAAVKVSAVTGENMNYLVRWIEQRYYTPATTVSASVSSPTLEDPESVKDTTSTISTGASHQAKDSPTYLARSQRELLKLSKISSTPANISTIPEPSQGSSPATPADTLLQLPIPLKGPSVTAAKHASNSISPSPESFHSPEEP
uniref:Uncharacterized protein AlNc14C62G4514 n=1 Tax=Albugo laibachii Nc14 TaxID=890382 RepID=F0WCZ0_9STRA|nr:conserved hypothetical protein [Albugo laibachii Nc14]|eukprot:CCA19061.1 conserved hypothetical protein [Albugo laibachii Nc14]